MYPARAIGPPNPKVPSRTKYKRNSANVHGTISASALSDFFPAEVCELASVFSSMTSLSLCQDAIIEVDQWSGEDLPAFAWASKADFNPLATSSAGPFPQKWVK